MVSTNVDAEEIAKRYWRLLTGDGRIVSPRVEFLTDGRIFGLQGASEVYWKIEQDKIIICNNERVPTAALNLSNSTGCRIRFAGPHIPNPDVTLVIEEVGFSRPSFGSLKYSLETEIRYLGWTIGDHTYGMPSFYEEGVSKFTIGKYCSIADGCKIVLGDHRADFATTYPFATLAQYWRAPKGVLDHKSKGDTTIGSDVWIGSDAFIGSGVNIGHGAVIGARAVVTKDVPPYAVAVGVPASVIKFRFEPRIVNELLELSWWDLDDEFVEELLPLMLTTDIGGFIAALRDVRSKA